MPVWLESEGKIVYYTRWAFVETPKDILDYYWSWIHRETGMRLMKPKQGSHISLIRAEPIETQLYEAFWKKRHEEIVRFEYSPELQTNGDHWWLPVRCETLRALREEMGLTANPPYGFHLTIGRTLNLPTTDGLL